MNNNNNFSRGVAVINQQNNFAICLPTNNTIDTIGAATALYFGLTKLGKNASLACAFPISSQINLKGVEKIQKSLGSDGNTLVISFPYVEGAVDKVTYNIEGNYFNLIIQPSEGQSKLDHSAIKYSYTGGKVDVIITIDASSLNSLGDLYLQNQQQFTGKEIINIDRHLTNTNFGTINLVDRESSSTSEIVFKLLEYLNVEIDKEMATNLYAGIVSATNNFTAYSVNAQTFEISAKLLRLGAVKRPMRLISSLSTPPPSTPTPTETVIIPPKTIEKKEIKTEENTPKDWLKPKIFRGPKFI